MQRSEVRPMQILERKKVAVVLGSLAIGLFLPDTPAAAQRASQCTGGIYGVEQGLLMGTGGDASGLEEIVIAYVPEIGGYSVDVTDGTTSCSATRVRLRGRRDGTTRVKARWRTGECSSFEGSARLKATIDDGCLTMDGFLRVARSARKRPFVAAIETLKPFRSIQDVFTGSCSLGLCHSTFARKGGLILDSETVSYGSLVDRPAEHPEAQAMDLMRVVSGEPENSFLIRKLRGLGPGTSMPQVGQQLPEPIIQMIEEWILRGAHTTTEECPTLDDGLTTGAASVARHGDSGEPTVCDAGPIDPGDFVWEPEPPLAEPAPAEGMQLFVPRRDVEAGTEWETCYAFKPDWNQIAADIGVASPLQIVFNQQVYRMHSGSHHLLLYAYHGNDPNGWTLGQHFPCSAGQCLTPGDCPSDASQRLTVGGTQVAGVRYEVSYPPGVGLPANLLSGGDTVLIANLHYTNPFQPPQPIYGEAWLNLLFQPPGEFTALLDGIISINYLDLIVEPYETRTISRFWQPRSILTGQQADAAVFQLFGHMHLRGETFQIDFVKDGSCSASGDICGRDEDCACKPYQNSCQDGQTCQLGPDAEDTTIYYSAEWDNQPVVDYPYPYFPIDRDQGLRYTCQHTNGYLGDPTRPPKKCHEGCEACGWDEGSRTCIFTRGVQIGVDQAPRVYQEGDPMPLVWGELADDDMCNMFGYFIAQSAVPVP